jgi:hypothetical protein
MGFPTAGFFARIFRLSWFGHHIRLAEPLVGWGALPCATGQADVSWDMDGSSIENFEL